MQTIFMTKGLPGSGKSTWAKQQVEGSKGKIVRVNKDDIRMMLHAGRYSKENEKAVLAARDTLVARALDDGKDVIVDDTNFEPKHEERMRGLAYGIADVKIVDFTDVPLDKCLENNQKRAIGQGFVPPDVIVKMWKRYLKPARPAPPAWVPGLPEAIIVDVDGTVALNTGGRDFYDWSRVSEDTPNTPVVGLVSIIDQWRLDSGRDVHFIFLSGRDAVCEADTTTFISDQLFSGYQPFQLYMRPKGDQRDDRIVKRELYEAHVKGKYNVLFVLDDRNKVVDMWRNELGLTCLQVAEGDF